jgi:hypothetical protein
MRSRFVVAVVVGAALVLVALAARGNSPVTFGERGWFGGGSDQSPVSTPEEVQADGLAGIVGGSVVVVLVVLVGLLFVGMAVMVIPMIGPIRRRPRRGYDAVAENDEEAVGSAPSPAFLLTGARNALSELRERPAGPPSDAVVAAWLRLEEAAAESGVPRLDHETPTEFTGALLVRYEVDTDAAATLRGLYQRARFGPAGQVSTQDAALAAHALERIVVSLDRTWRR